MKQLISMLLVLSTTMLSSMVGVTQGATVDGSGTYWCYQVLDETDPNNIICTVLEQCGGGAPFATWYGPAVTTKDKCMAQVTDCDNWFIQEYGDPPYCG